MGTWLRRPPTLLLRTAYHEVGHLLAAEVTGIGAVATDLRPDGAGRIITRLRAIDAGPTEESARIALCSRIVTFGSGLAVDRDRRVSDWQSAREDLDAIDRMAGYMWPRCVRDQMLDRLRRVAEELTATARPAIGRLVDALLSEPFRLDGEAARSLIGGDLRPLGFLIAGEIEAVSRVRVIRAL